MKESILEQSILEALARRKYFAVKVRDQAKRINGAYRKGGAFELRGFSDLVVFLPNGVAIFMEIKTSTGKQSQFQVAFQNKLTSLNHIYVVVRSVKEAIEAVEKYS